MRFYYSSTCQSGSWFTFVGAGSWVLSNGHPGLQSMTSVRCKTPACTCYLELPARTACEWSHPCNSTWQCRAAGWYKTSTGNWYCKKCTTEEKWTIPAYTSQVLGDNLCVHCISWANSIPALEVGVAATASSSSATAATTSSSAARDGGMGPGSVKKMQ